MSVCLKISASQYKDNEGANSARDGRAEYLLGLLVGGMVFRHCCPEHPVGIQNDLTACRDA